MTSPCPRPDRVRSLRTAVLFLSLAAGTVPASATAQIAPDAAARIAARTRFLATDLLEGRGTASRGAALAAAYLRAELEALELEAPGEAPGFLQPVPLVSLRTGPGTRAVIEGPGGTRTLRPPTFYHPGGPPDAWRDVSGELLFAGATTGALAALDRFGTLEGQVVVLGPPWEGVDAVEGELRRRGAEAIVQGVPNAFYERLRVVRGPVRYALRPGVPGADVADSPPVLVTGPEGIEALGLAGALEPGRALAEARPLGSRLAVRFDVTVDSTADQNVAAIVPGSDPALAGEVVALTAHYDHVGIGEPAQGDSIWNGFADNASGVAVVLEVARALSADPPPRSVLILFTAAEEQGLLGATLAAARPPTGGRALRAVLNVDGGIPPAGTDGWNLQGGEDSAAGRAAIAAIRAAGAEAEAWPVLPHSDHWAFHRSGLPALFLHPAGQWEGAAPHTPGDEWSPEAPFDALVRYAEVTLAAVRALAGAGP